MNCSEKKTFNLDNGVALHSFSGSLGHLCYHDNHRRGHMTTANSKVVSTRATNYMSVDTMGSETCHMKICHRDSTCESIFCHYHQLLFANVDMSLLLCFAVI